MFPSRGGLIESLRESGVTEFKFSSRMFTYGFKKKKIEDRKTLSQLVQRILLHENKIHLKKNETEKCNYILYFYYFLLP